MTQEDKELLLKDLCARLPYGVKMCYTSITDAMSKTWELIGINQGHCDIVIWNKARFSAVPIEGLKSYLRPMSSMTEEEEDWYYNFIDRLFYHESASELVDWLNKHHFDYRGLIEKGLALEASKDMY